MDATEVGERGCGEREPGGVYMRTLMGTRGDPLEKFLVDPPIPCPPDMLIPERGVSILERPGFPGVFDVYDRVGKKYYPNVADFFEEVRRSGLSRRIKRDARLELLSPASKIILVHERAIIDNCAEYYDALIEEANEYPEVHPFRCLCETEKHDGYPWESDHKFRNNTREMCVSLWWDDIKSGTNSLDPSDPPRTVERELGDTTYVGRKKPKGIDPLYTEGIFMVLPIHRLDVIEDTEDGRHEPALEQARRSGLPVKLEKK